jgi:hypothetical protein
MANDGAILFGHEAKMYYLRMQESKIPGVMSPLEGMPDSSEALNVWVLGAFGSWFCRQNTIISTSDKKPSGHIIKTAHSTRWEWSLSWSYLVVAFVHTVLWHAHSAPGSMLVLNHLKEPAICHKSLVST